MVRDDDKENEEVEIFKGFGQFFLLEHFLKIELQVEDVSVAGS